MPEAVAKGARFVKTAPEQADFPAKSLDWVLILDSINTFSDPLSVLKRAWQWLVVGGGVLIVDRNPFLLLTDSQKDTWGMGARTRNSTVSEVVHWLEEAGFVPDQVTEPVPGRTNLWFVTAKKRT
jgi:ubiquinone/menaquinone biosynthesis C-methylase UbiE